MLTIRFQRFGKKHQPTFRVVVKERRSSPQGKYLEKLGWYNPRSNQFQLDEERIRYWLGQGAQVSDTAWNLLVRAGIVTGPKRPVHKREQSETQAAA